MKDCAKDYDKAQIQAVIDQYRLSEILSESEVRSKFIVGLSEALGYPSPLRGEEFPVYGYAGGECLRAKMLILYFFRKVLLEDTGRIPRTAKGG